ncbi:D-inositol-3-phosphate glycosyltransferase [Dactylosporangium salmoneum]|uniref:D-inositol-3-phosphate glycosyltransferase n=1 Tax=Dactylosporangium salmoneum TaxID=53361 RepID=A0ABP5U8K3_9ACTN
MPLAPPRRVAIVSVLTSPLAQPGSGDAGGLNVYVAEVARRLAAAGTEVEIFTRATAPEAPGVVAMAPGVVVRHVVAGPLGEMDKADLPGVLDEFTAGLLATGDGFDVVHGHHWLSGAGALTAVRAWGVPLVQSMHSLGKARNASLAPGDAPAPEPQIAGETAVVAAADRLVANTAQEARQLVRLYGARPAQVCTVHPGADLSLFRPGPATAARRRFGIPPDALVLLFAGRVQPLKAPDLLLHVAAALVRERPGLADRLRVVVVGGPSGSGRDNPHRLTKLAAGLGVAGLVRFEPPCPQAELADWYRAATVVVMPSRAETFGLVAVEAQACGTPVVGAAVGGLRTAIRDGVSGVLVEGRDPAAYARAIGRLVADPDRLRRLSAGALAHAAGFGWDETVDRLREVYADAVGQLRSAGASSAGANSSRS